MMIYIAWASMPRWPVRLFTFISLLIAESRISAFLERTESCTLSNRFPSRSLNRSTSQHWIDCQQNTICVTKVFYMIFFETKQIVCSWAIRETCTVWTRSRRNCDGSKNASRRVALSRIFSTTIVYCFHAMALTQLWFSMFQRFCSFLSAARFVSIRLTFAQHAQPASEARGSIEFTCRATEPRLIMKTIKHKRKCKQSSWKQQRRPRLTTNISATRHNHGPNNAAASW